MSFLQNLVFDAEGRLVTWIPPVEGRACRRWVTWDGSDADGRPVSSGVYFVRAEGGEPTGGGLRVVRIR